MSMQDPVADMLTCVRNAQMMGIRSICVPHSKLKLDILNVLQSEGYIESAEETAEGSKKNISINLKYYEGRPVIERIKRISRPALRVYRGYHALPLVRGGIGISIISTSKGVMADKVARAQRLGGEILCTVE